MALVVGTNCGFVTTAPTTDPEGVTGLALDTFSLAFKVTAPATAIKVTEIGWWCGSATPDANFEVGVYDHNTGDNNPENLLAGADQTNAKGTTTGWKSVTGLNISITPSTTYWLAVQLDATTPDTFMNTTSTVGEKMDRSSETTLQNPWGASDATVARLVPIYAVWEAGAPTGTNSFINIGDSFKSISQMYVNIADTFRKLSTAYINIGDAWKKIF